MQRKRTLLGAVVVVGIVSALGFSSFGGAAVHRVSQLIAPTANSAVGDVNAYTNWGVNNCGSTCSKAGFKSVTHFDTGIYCLGSPTAVPDKSALLVTVDQQHSVPASVGLGSIMWDRSSPNCGSSKYEVYTYCGTAPPPPPPPPSAPARLAPAPDTLCDDIAFYAEAYVR
jgi:hypothetical protein